MKSFGFLTILFLLSSSLKAQDFVYDVQLIKDYLSKQVIDLKLKDPTQKTGIEGAYFTSYMPSLYHGPMQICLKDERPKDPRYEVLLVTEQVPQGTMILDPRIYHIVMVKYDEQNKAPSPAPGTVAPSEDHIVKFRSESMDNIIHFANDKVEFNYATGMQVMDLEGSKGVDTGTPSAVEGDTYDASKVNWVKRADLKLKLRPDFQLYGSVIIQESLGPQGQNKEIKDWEQMKFFTNQVNVNVGTVVELGPKVKLLSSLTYEDSIQGKTAGASTGVEVRIPNAGQLMIFTAYKAPISTENPNFFVPLTNVGGAASGVKFKTEGGIEIKSGVSGLGTTIPMVETGLSIPLDKPKKK